jgi:hypothetical protein
MYERELPFAAMVPGKSTTRRTVADRPYTTRHIGIAFEMFGVSNRFFAVVWLSE